MGVTYINPYRFAAFSPLDLSPALWLDASDTSTITSSGSPAKVSQWNDKSGNVRNVTQATAAAQPTTGASTQNSLNIISFDGGDRLLNSSTNQYVNASTGNFSAFAVAKSDVLTGSTGKQIVCADSGAGNRQQQFLRFQFAYGQTIAFNTSNTAFSDETANITGSNMVLLSAVVGSNCEVWLNGSSNGAGSTITGTLRTSATAIAVGANTNATAGELLTGTIAEIIIYPSALSATDRQRVETYLNAKWAVY